MPATLQVIGRVDVRTGRSFDETNLRWGDRLRVRSGGTYSCPVGTVGQVARDTLVVSTKDLVTIRTDDGVTLTQSYLHYDIVRTTRAAGGLLT